MVPATAVKVADVAPDATLTDDGMLSNVVSLERVTVTPPDPAGCVNVTVQFVTQPEFTVEGLQDTRLTDVAARSAIDAVCELPL